MQEWLLLQEGIWVYIMIFAALMGGACGLPIPEDIPLIVAGILVHQGDAKLSLIFLVCYLAIILGDILIFSVGRKFGAALFNKPWFQARVSTARLKRVRFNLERRSLLMIFIARHLFYLRTVTFLVCGAVKMNFSRFLVADLIAALVSVPIMMSLGYIGSEHYEEVVGAMKKVKTYSLILGIVLGAAATYYFFVIRRRRQPPLEGDAPSSPN